METVNIVFDENRRLLIVPLDSWIADPAQEFAALAPAWTAADILEAKNNFARLIAFGSCLEICCVGPRSEELHDALDEIIEDCGQLSVVTTSQNDPTEGCDYFLRLSGGRPKLLVTFASANPELVQTLVGIIGV